MDTHECFDDFDILPKPLSVAYQTITSNPKQLPQTLNYLLMKEILSYLYFGISGVCSRDLLDFS